ncbi:uncharacterized protein LOC106456848 [Limulus polyphemus]|uniref:Uncharacterized protein LOC106456848 n=1 Tax=Limulus polyphemus TaxID=6850 RepID=A0ABM1S3Y4_LIMPO|nr:uncharacterized protein LOC106456848 [Limulus polyphemus]XP_022238340.1 uncharacterized protein LOC106456848 [Limulus polyphemus]
MRGIFLLLFLQLAKGLSLDEIHAYQNPPDISVPRRSHPDSEKFIPWQEFDESVVPYPFNSVYNIPTSKRKQGENTALFSSKHGQLTIPDEGSDHSAGIFAAGISNRLLSTLQEIDRQMAQKEARRDYEKQMELYNQLEKRQRYGFRDENTVPFMERSDYDIDRSPKSFVYSFQVHLPSSEPSYWRGQRYSLPSAFSSAPMGRNRWPHDKESNRRMEANIWNKNRYYDLSDIEEPYFNDILPLSTSNKETKITVEEPQFPIFHKKQKTQTPSVDPEELQEFFQARNIMRKPGRELSKSIFGENTNGQEDEQILNSISSEIERRKNKEGSIAHYLDDSFHNVDDSKIDEYDITKFSLKNSPPYFDEPKSLILKKREYTNSDSVKATTASELSDIFKDDGDERNMIKRRTESSEETISERQNEKNETNEATNRHNTNVLNHFDEVTTEIITEEPQESHPSTPKQNFETWLKKEYIKNMAKALNILRKKRSNDWASVFSKNIDDLLQHGRNGVSNRKKGQKTNIIDQSREEDYKNIEESVKKQRYEEEKEDNFVSQKLQFEEAEKKIKQIEKAMIAVAMKMIKESTPDGTLFDEEKISHRLEAAKELKNLRQALAHLHTTLDKIEQESQESEDNTSKNNEGIKDVTLRWPHFFEKKRELEKYGDEDGEHKLFEDQPSYGVNPDMTANVYHYSRGQPRQQEDDYCPPLKLLTSDCAAVDEYLPNESLRRLLRHACNWHDVCYTCGKAFGLTSEDCDGGFSEESVTLCRGDRPCETATRLILRPLRETKVFFKRSIPQMCYLDSCVEEFLKGR